MVSASSMDVSVSVNVTVATVTLAPVMSGRFDVPVANVTPLYVGSAAGAHEQDGVINIVIVELKTIPFYMYSCVYICCDIKPSVRATIIQRLLVR